MRIFDRKIEDFLRFESGNTANKNDYDKMSEEYKTIVMIV